MLQTAATETVLQDIPILELVESHWNPRRHYDETTLQELAESIRVAGVIEPIVVRRVTVDATPRFEILAGSRRFRASKIAGLDTMPAVIRDLDDLAAIELATIENLQREDVHPLDEANGYQALMKAAKKQYTPATVAAKVGKSESYVYRRLKLLDLEPDLMAALSEDRLSVAHAERLLRLAPPLRAEAAHAGNGVVWRRSPLLEYGEEWIPQRDDLRPLSELEHFIRTRSHFDPTSRDTKHFQPDLVAKMETVDAGDGDTDEAAADAVSSLVELSDDPMARMRLKAGKNERIPLTPSKWREVTSEKHQCAHTVRGVVTHGGPYRVLEVCITRSCPKHFPKAKPTTALKRSKATEDTARAKQQTREREEQERRDVERAEWEAIAPALDKAFVGHVARVKVNGAFVRQYLDSWTLKEVKDRFGVSLTDATAAQVLVLGKMHSRHRPHAEAAMSAWDFDVKGFTKAWRAARAAEGKSKLDTQRAEFAKTGIGLVIRHAMDRFEGGYERFRAACKTSISNADLDALIRKEFGEGGYMGDDCRYEMRSGKLAVSHPVKTTLTIPQIRPIVVQILSGVAPQKAVKGKKTAMKKGGRA